eukprot:2431974-Prymnesium_polylepis.1
MERQLCAEVEEARQLAATIRASLDQGIVGSRSWGTTEGDDDVEEKFKELCEAAGIAPGDIYRPTSRVPRATGAVKAGGCCIQAQVPTDLHWVILRVDGLERSHEFVKKRQGAAERRLRAA